MGSATVGDFIATTGRGVHLAYGMTPAFFATAAARLAAAQPELTLVVLVPDDAISRAIAGDLRRLLPPLPDAAEASAPPRALTIPAIETSPYAELSPDRLPLMQRMTALFRLSHGGSLAPRALVVSAGSLARRVMPRGELERLTDTVRADRAIDRDATATLLIAAGYTRVPVVEDPGTFAVRGGVVDVYPPLYSYPIRIELFGDDIETMRSFDPQTQRTLRDIGEICLHPVRETVPTSGADVRKRILEAADAAVHPSKQTRRILELIESREEFVGVETLTPAFHREMVPLWSYFPPAERAVWLVFDPDAIERAVIDEDEAAAARYAERLADHKLAFPPEAHFVGATAITEAIASAPNRIEARSLELVTVAALAAEQARPRTEGNRSRAEGKRPAATETMTEALPTLRYAVDANIAIRSELERARRHKADELMRPLVDAIATWRQTGWRIAITCDGAARVSQLTALLADYGVPSSVRDADPISFDGIEPGAPPVVFKTRLSAGFALPDDRLVVLTDDDIFGERRHTSTTQKAAAKRARAALMGGVADFAQLQPGEFVVHTLHGVGLYHGLVKLPLRSNRQESIDVRPAHPQSSIDHSRMARSHHGGTPIDFLHLEYDGGTLYLPVYRLNEVQRYVGAEGHKPRIDKLGGFSFDKSRRKVKREVQQLAEELLQLYAQRASLPGHAFPSGDAMFHEFEATFEFEETPDQQTAIDQVLGDMEQPRPMDRLVCGDVGYGKTEVALRAILKATLGNKQAALLAPTTVLVEQHYQTMVRRYTGWPLNIAKLSRFQTKAEQLAVVRGLAEGRIDAVVGTHRLLSKDVRFKDLGLLVVDEEQRFGVTHKERLKKVRTQVDVLTLTATPIPRTLHLAMTGLREISIIATPPADRRSIRTFVAMPEDGVLREGIRRELARGGQVFFVVPRIVGPVGAPGPAMRDRSLDEWVRHLAELVPEAKIAGAHGQMSGDQLEAVMVKFVGGEHDVLVSTTIIESGLDIPRANTMFVARADAFGLAQLYQLRGRIGRSKERAFCYLLVPPPQQLTDDARRRLETLQRFTDLGAGFSIASHDLEIRGAGELLGAKQSGAIAAVGFDAYTQMLEDAVAELRGEEIHHERDPELNVDVPGFIPDDYVPDTGQRLDLYKRLSSTRDEDDVAAILDEIRDRYGDLPLEVTLLADLMVLKAHARRIGAQSLDLSATRLSLALAEDTPLSPQKILALVNQRQSRYRLTPDMRLTRAFDEAEQKQPTLAAKGALLELAACAT